MVKNLPAMQEEAQQIKELALVVWLLPSWWHGVAEPQLRCGRGSVCTEPRHSWLARGEEGPVIESPQAESNVNQDNLLNWELP